MPPKPDLAALPLPADAPMLVDAAADGTPGNARSPYRFVLSADGTKAAFVSSADNLDSGERPRTPDGSVVEQVYVKDLGTGAVTRVSDVGANGIGSLAISGDGNVVAYYGGLQTPQGIRFGVEARDVATGRQISTFPGCCNAIFLSDDGSVAAFSSSDATLVAGDTNHQVDGFVKNLRTGEIRRVSTDSAGHEAALDPKVLGGMTGGEGERLDLSAVAGLSGDGTAVVFNSRAANLVAGDTNRHQDVFVKNLLDGTTTRVSTTAAGGQTDDGASCASISRDGRYVAFKTDDGQPLRRDLRTGAVALVAASKKTCPRLLGDGMRIAYATATKPIGTGNAVHIVLANFDGSDARVAARTSDYRQFLVAAAGNRVVWQTKQRLVGSDSDGEENLYSIDLT